MYGDYGQNVLPPSIEMCRSVFVTLPVKQRTSIPFSGRNVKLLQVFHSGYTKSLYSLWKVTERIPDSLRRIQSPDDGYMGQYKSVWNEGIPLLVQR